MLFLQPESFGPVDSFFDLQVSVGHMPEWPVEILSSFNDCIRSQHCHHKIFIIWHIEYSRKLLNKIQMLEISAVTMPLGGTSIASRMIC